MMKYLLLAAIIVIAYLFWRNARIDARNARNQQKPQSGPQDMVRCPVCAVHLPRSDAVAGADGVLYCSQEHRLKAGG